MAAAAVCALAAAPAYAQITLSSTDGNAVYGGPSPTYDFETPAPVTGGLVTTGSNSSTAQPLGSTGNYWTVGPTNGTPGVLDLSNFAAIGAISFIWGSVDTYNTLEVLDRVGNVLKTFTGTDAAIPANGNQTAADTNPLVRISIAGADQYNIGGLKLISTQNAFETDNFAVTAVPEPAIWALLLIGFGFIGAFLRGEKRKQRKERMRLKFI